MKKIIITTSILLSSLMLIIIYQLSQLPLQLPQPNDIGKYQTSITSEIIDGEVYVYELKINTENGDTWRQKIDDGKYDGRMATSKKKFNTPRKDYKKGDYKKKSS